MHAATVATTPRPLTTAGAGADIDFYFDFASPYGYFMSERIDAVAQRHRRKVVWRPVLLFAVLRALELPAPLAHPAKRAYMVADFARSARFMGIRYAMPPRFPIITPYAARAFYLLAAHAPDVAVTFAHTVMHNYWQRGLDISDIGLVADLATLAGPWLGDSAQIRERLRSDTAKALLEEAVACAVAHRVFGSPFVVVGGEAFFGVDRLPQIEAHLARVEEEAVNRNGPMNIAAH